MAKPMVALCILYVLGTCCAIAATVINSGVADGLVAAALALCLPAWMLCVRIVEDDA